MGRYNLQTFKQTITIADSASTGESTASALNGILRAILLDIPDLTGAGTVTCDIILVDGAEEFTLFSKASIAENANGVVVLDGQNNPLQIPLAGSIKVKLTASAGAQTGAKNIPTTLLIDRG